MNSLTKQRILTEDDGLFLTLGKYVQRQQENLMTQAFVAAFNHSNHFKKIFMELIERKDLLKSIDTLHAKSQRSKSFGRGQKLIVDAEIYDTDYPAQAIATIESKLEAVLGPKQLENYAKYLKKRPGQLVIITKYGVNPQLVSKLQRRSTIWITWGQFSSFLHEKNHQSKLDNFLVQEFINMLNHNGIRDVSNVSVAGWNKLKLVKKMILTEGDQSIHYDAIETIRLIMDRMIVFRDSVWESLAEQNWKPYQRLYKYNDECVEIEVGFKYSYIEKRILKTYIYFLA